MIGSYRLHMTVAAAGLIGLAGLSYVLAGAPQPSGDSSALVEFTPDGKMKRPEGYREWIYIGTPLTPNDMNGGEAAFPEFHAVYIDRDSFTHFKKTGEFRDGTVLVKDLVSVGSKEAPSGKGYFEGDFNGMDVSIKDSKRFKDEPGNWGYFTFGHKPPLKAEAAMNNAAKDWVFSQYYPALRAAAPKSK